MRVEATGESPNYGVPALDKALDILELLAGSREGKTLGEIAAAVDRSINQIYRTLVTLERRGYLFRARPSGLYFLSLMMFELAHRQEPMRGLIDMALPAMRVLSEAIGQSCNLSLHDAGRVVVIAQIDSPSAFGFRVRAGATFPLFESATGRLLMAFEPEEKVRPWLDGADAAVRATMPARLAVLREQGYEEEADGLQPGITDLVFPIFSRDGRVVAALTVPYVATSYSRRPIADVRVAANKAATDISAAIAGAVEDAQLS
ncbi:IclR family transcriptional regulator [Kaistia granuli]|uniref:IclR family transcriptional regulator n=1 Tax=Kaistia granuli TaxID=363259 RepID=UPI00037AB02E|nr:IclR family transcriptional regulator [Kaistia granuli]